PHHQAARPGQAGRVPLLLQVPPPDDGGRRHRSVTHPRLSPDRSGGEPCRPERPSPTAAPPPPPSPPAPAAPPWGSSRWPRRPPASSPTCSTCTPPPAR